MPAAVGGAPIHISTLGCTAHALPPVPDSGATSESASSFPCLACPPSTFFLFCIWPCPRLPLRSWSSISRCLHPLRCQLLSLFVFLFLLSLWLLFIPYPIVQQHIITHEPIFARKACDECESTAFNSFFWVHWCWVSFCLPLHQVIPFEGSMHISSFMDIMSDSLSSDPCCSHDITCRFSLACSVPRAWGQDGLAAGLAASFLQTIFSGK